MRATHTAIREMPITERAAPQSGPATGKAVAKDGTGIAVATGTNSFFIVNSADLGDEVQIGARLSLRFSQGRVSLRQRSETRKIDSLCVDEVRFHYRFFHPLYSQLNGSKFFVVANTLRRR